MKGAYNVFRANGKLGSAFHNFSRSTYYCGSVSTSGLVQSAHL